MILDTINKIKLINKVRNKTYLFLRWTEKWTKTDMIYLTKGGFWLTLGQGISTISSLIIAIAFANLIPKEVYGNYKYVLSIVSILSITTIPGMGIAIIRSVSRGYDKSYKTALVTKIKWGVIGSITALLFGIYYYIQGNFPMSISFLIAGMFLPFLETFNLYSFLLIGKKLFRISTKYNIIIKIINTIIMLIIIFFTQNLIIIIITYFASHTIMRLIFSIITISNLKLNNKEDNETINYAKHLSVMELIAIIAGQIDKILIFNYLGAIELAIYSFATVPVEHMKALLKNVSLLGLPKFAEKNITEIKKTIFKKMTYFAIVIAVITISYILLAPYIFHYIFPQYKESVLYSQIFSLSLVSVLLFIPLNIMKAQKMTKELYRFQTITSVVQIILIIILINPYGLIGVIISRTITRLFNLIYSIAIIKNHKNTSPLLS